LRYPGDAEYLISFSLLFERYRDFEKTEVAKKAAVMHNRLLVICMSANSDAETKQLAMELGMDGFIEKPFKFKELAKYYGRHKFGTGIEE